ncbi:hypothetical protein N7539_004708 [Penicillium diatomitis]|uniref:Uncharacterized protein n=1 Tax=Penicillium diatomitis TaxID=2819901 RepID=A0A9W9X6R6_9EURO|nr:uncharacterized protein N7539_004708 [Penicillium diatomitis]KAJ5484720.1 hypothetical protein N7539_004708 [Penicillium diatomitis]
MWLAGLGVWAFPKGKPCAASVHDRMMISIEVKPDPLLHQIADTSVPVPVAWAMVSLRKGLISIREIYMPNSQAKSRGRLCVYGSRPSDATERAEVPSLVDQQSLHADDPSDVLSHR